jgi:hypothetical protein
MNTKEKSKELIVERNGQRLNGLASPNYCWGFAQSITVDLDPLTCSSAILTNPPKKFKDSYLFSLIISFNGYCA